jgi:hypothetical protein
MNCRLSASEWIHRAVTPRDSAPIYSKPFQMAQSSLVTIISLLVGDPHSRHATRRDRVRTEQLQRQRQGNGPSRSRRRSTNA